MNLQSTQNKSKNDGVANYLLAEWDETRKLTLDFVNDIPLEKLNVYLPRPGLNTFHKHLIEMAQVQRAYVKVLTGKKLDFSEITDGKDIKPANSKKKIVSLMNKEDRFFQKSAEKVKDWNKRVKVFGGNYPLYSVLEFMTRHETLHHGQFVAFGYFLDIKFPDSWIKQWALPRN